MLRIKRLPVTSTPSPMPAKTSTEDEPSLLLAFVWILAIRGPTNHDSNIGFVCVDRRIRSRCSGLVPFRGNMPHALNAAGDPNAFVQGAFCDSEVKPVVAIHCLALELNQRIGVGRVVEQEA